MKKQRIYYVKNETLQISYRYIVLFQMNNCVKSHHGSDRHVLLHRPQPGDVRVPQAGETPLPPQVRQNLHVWGK